MDLRALIFYIFATICVITAIIDAIKLDKFLSEKVEIEMATIVRIDIIGSEPIYYSKLATVSYFIEGKFYVSDNRILVSRFASVGDEVAIRYYINKPSVLYNRIIEPHIIYLTLSFISALFGVFISKL